MSSFEIGALLAASAAALKDLGEARDLGLKALDLMGQRGASLGQVRQQLSSCVDLVTKVQHQALAIDAHIAQLEREDAKSEAFRREISRYRLKEVAPGTLLYVVEEDHDRAEPAHCICTNCAADEVKSLLQRDPAQPGFLRCPRCKTEFRVGPASSGPASGLETGWDPLDPYGD